MRDLVCSYYTLAGVSPTAGGHSPLRFEDRVSAAAAAGYTGIGLHVRDYRALIRAGYDDARLRGILADNGMRHIEVEFLQNWFADGEAGAASRSDEDTLCHMAEAFDARVLFLSGDLAAGNTMPLDELAARFAALCERTARRGVRIGLEPAAWTNVGTVDEALALIDAAGAANAGLFLDVWHLYRRGYDYNRIPALDPSRIYGVQLDDAAAQTKGTPLEDCLDHRLLPGEGDADVAAFVAALAQIGYDAPVSVEVISIAHRARSLGEAARQSHDTARALIDGVMAQHG